MKIALYYNGARGEVIRNALFMANDGHTNYINPSVVPECDLAIVAGYPRIFTAEELKVPKHGFINCHAGQVPEYRGGSPLNWALINGANTITCTVLRVIEGIDTGAIAISECFDVPKDADIDSLHEKVNSIFPGLILKVLAKIEKYGIMYSYRQTGTPRYWPQRTARDSEITLDMTPKKVYDKVRACREPYPAFIRLGKHRYKMELI